MVLVDTSVWVDHLSKGLPALKRLLDSDQVLSHPCVIGELAMGNLKNRDLVLSALGGLPKAVVAQHDEVLHFISSHSLFGLGIGYIDAQLLAAVRITPHTLLWTRDKRLHKVALRLSIAHIET